MTSALTTSLPPPPRPSSRTAGPPAPVARPGREAATYIGLVLTMVLGIALTMSSFDVLAPQLSMVTPAHRRRTDHAVPYPARCPTRTVGHLRPTPRRLAKLAGRVRAQRRSRLRGPLRRRRPAGQRPLHRLVVDRRTEGSGQPGGDAGDADHHGLDRGDRLALIPAAPHADAASSPPSSRRGRLRTRTLPPAPDPVHQHLRQRRQPLGRGAVGAALRHLRRRVLRLAQGPLRQRVAGRLRPRHRERLHRRFGSRS